MLRSRTLVGAHAREASRERSSAGFISNLGGSLHEGDETRLWLELPQEECNVATEGTAVLEGEASELIASMATMITRTRANH